MPRVASTSLTAQKLRLILVGIIILLLVAGVGIFLYGKNIIAQYANDVEKTSQAAASSGQNLTALSTLKTTLAEDADAIDRTRSLVAESQSYAYQEQIIKDITTLATKAGITISGFQFNNEGAAGATATTGAAAAPAASSSAATTAVPQVSGLKTVSVAITPHSPVEYKDIMDFIHMLEQNLTRMQLEGISLTRDATTGKITVSSLTVEVYTR